MLRKNSFISIQVLFYFFGLTSCCQAASYFAYTDQTKQVYEHILCFELQLANQTLTQGLKADPNNRAYDLLANCIDFLNVFVYEQQADLKRLKPLVRTRIQRLQTLSDSDPWKHFAEAEMLLQLALAQLKFDELISAFQNISAANSRLVFIKKTFPEWKHANKSLGAIQAIVSTIPSDFSWGLKLAGLEGDLHKGVQALQEHHTYCKLHKDLYLDESTIILAFVKAYLSNKSTEAISLIKEANFSCHDSPILLFLKAKILMRCDAQQEAGILLKQHTFAPSRLPYLHYLIGLHQLHELQNDASKHFNNYLTYFKGRSYIKESYQKLAWHALIQGDTIGYKRNMQSVIQRGYAITDEDKQALKEAKSGSIPDVILLKARLLCDGGQYSRAYALLQAKLPQYYQSKHPHKIEAAYRMARICHLKKDYPEALSYYADVASFNDFSKSYMPCAAALYSGQILETQGKSSIALTFYKLCLQLDSDQYKRSLHQKAKAGIARLTN